MMDVLMNNLPVFLPVIVLEMVLAVTALVHVLRHRHYRFGNCIMWALIVLFIQIIGPVVYFVFGRGEEEWKS